MNICKMSRASFFAALMAVCGWISVPVPPFRYTLQTFALYLALLTLGGKWGFRAVAIYLGLGAVGLPVFSGFRSGIGALLDVTGGFLWGFLAGAMVYRLLEKTGKIYAMAVSLLSCYLCGCIWFTLYTGEQGFGAALIICVVPYVIPDTIKLWLAWIVAKKLKNK